MNKKKLKKIKVTGFFADIEGTNLPIRGRICIKK